MGREKRHHVWKARSRRVRFLIHVPGGCVLLSGFRTRLKSARTARFETQATPGFGGVCRKETIVAAVYAILAVVVTFGLLNLIEYRRLD